MDPEFNFSHPPVQKGTVKLRRQKKKKTPLELTYACIFRFVGNPVWTDRVRVL
jgi:hypothetical protein